MEESLKNLLLAIAVVATLAACENRSTSPDSRLAPTLSSNSIGDVHIMCDSNVDPGCGANVQIPADMTVEANVQGGAMVTLPVVIASTNLGDVPTSCSQSGTAFFPLGTTIVTCSVVDSYGATYSASYNVTVVDTTAPSIQASKSFAVTANSSTGVVVNYPVPQASDIAGAATVTCTPPSGSVFPVGTTKVICVATDQSGNSSSTSFDVTVSLSADPVAELVDALNAAINKLNLPPGIKAKLTAYVDKLPTTIAGLTDAQKADAIRKMQALIGVVSSLTPRSIPPAQASQIISLANQVIAALSNG